MRFGKLSRLVLCLLIVALVLPGMLLAQNGKIRGTVVDKSNGDPLNGASVQIQNTSYGAATNVNGEYIILNVPAGKYTLEVSYIGYKKMLIKDVVVTSGLTGYQEIEMETEVLEGEEIVITAVKPLFEKGKTNEIQVMRGEDLQHMPIRGVGGAIAQMAGVVRQGSSFYVRGGRANQTAYIVDGVNTSNNFGGGSMTTVIHGAIEEVQMQTGGYGAEYGGKMSGIAMTKTKTGTRKYHLTAEAISDDFWAVKDDAGSYEILGIDKLYSFGYNNYTLTASGPVIPNNDKIRFFIAAERHYEDSWASWFQGFHQDSMQVTSTSNYRVGSLLYNAHKDDKGNVASIRDTADLYIDVPPGRAPGGGYARSTLNSNIVFDFQPIRVQAGFNYSTSRSTPRTTNPRGLITVGESQSRITKPETMNGYLKLTHTVDPTMFYTLQASYATSKTEYGPKGLDWKFGADNFVIGDSGVYDEMFSSWSDPAKHNGLLDRNRGYGNFYMPFTGDFAFSHYMINDTLPGGTVRPDGRYYKRNEDKWTIKFDISKQFGTTHEVKFGGSYSTSVYRTYFIDLRDYYWKKRSYDLDPGRLTDYDFWSGMASTRGYDVYGNKVDKAQIVATKKGLNNSVDINIRNAPARPVNASFYLNDKVELKDLIINAGVRYEYMDYGHYSLANLDSLTKQTGNVIADEHFRDSKVYHYVLPRLGFSFPITDQAIFTAQYGKYIQRPSLTHTLTDATYQGYLFQLYGGKFFDPLNNVNLKPERTTEYNFGFKMKFGANAVLKMTAFYRNQQDLITLRHVIPKTNDYKTQSEYMNGDFATIKGISATFDLRRTNRIQARLNYTYQVASGSGSNGSSNRTIAWQEANPYFPRIIFPLNYDQRHKGTVVVDIRSIEGDGPEIGGVHPFENMGLNLMFGFHSGSPFTRIPLGDAFSSLQGFNAPPPVESPNSSRLPWVYNLDAKFEKTFTIGSMKLVAFLRGINILNLKSYTSVFRQTGRPDTDGWLQTNAGKALLNSTKMAGHQDDYIKWYNAALTNCGANRWQAPRQIRFGLRLEI